MTIEQLTVIAACIGVLLAVFTFIAIIRWPEKETQRMNIERIWGLLATLFLIGLMWFGCKWMVE